jgi:hypothetical protein
MSSKEIQKKIHYKEYRTADNIIRYLLNPNDSTVDLTDTEKRKLDLCKKIHGYRCNFKSKRDVAAIIVSMHGVSGRHAYNLINETEYIFGSVEGVAKDYERNFLLECSRKNLQLAFSSRNSAVITKALLAHYKLCGLDEYLPELPDFSKLEQHNYIINLPDQFIEALKVMLKAGSINLQDFIPAPDINSIEEAKEVKDDDET